jgi:hypothetical protein
VDGPWTTLADSACEPRNSWTSGLGRPSPATYIRSCPKGPRDRKRRRRCLHRRWRLRTRGSFGRFVVPVTRGRRRLPPRPGQAGRSTTPAASFRSVQARRHDPGRRRGRGPSRPDDPRLGTNVQMLWITLGIARPPRRISWTSGLGSRRARPYCRSCPKGPRTSSEPVGTCIDWRI